MNAAALLLTAALLPLGSDERGPSPLGEAERETAPVAWKEAAIKEARKLARAELPQRVDTLAEARRVATDAKLIGGLYLGEEYRGWFLFSFDVKNGCFPQRVYVAVRKGTRDVYEVPRWTTTW
jgi:hypothetical protein